MIYSEILNRIVEDESGCWEWNGAHSGTGYGQVRLDGRSQPVHRVVWEMLRGPIPEGLQIDHLCRNRGCCNPDHLEPVSQRVNLLRGISGPAINARKTHCPKGHEYDQVAKNGDRKCSICVAEYNRKYRKEHSTATKPRVQDRTHCPRGHEYTPDNTYVDPRGCRHCRICRKAQSRAWREKHAARQPNTSLWL